MPSGTTSDVEPLEFIDAGEDVVVAHVVRGRGKVSGVEVKLPTNVITVHDAAHYRDPHVSATTVEALEAAGLPE